jgi:EAL domain-containing protein (putative c-di-GMP-specific phosphodiesterase class I)
MTTLHSEDTLGSRLQFAAERGELLMVYQPKISLTTGEMAGVEALLRWQNPELGLILPATFIPLAERAGLIDILSEWVVQTILDQWSQWQDQGVKINIAFNISALTLRDVHFPDYLQRLCRAAGVPPDYLTIEVTESAAQHAIRLLDTITRFRIKGIAVEIDDFGTGYSSLLQLRELPYSGLKIDRCFIRDVLCDPDARVIVKSIIDLAHGLGLIATAEGAEDRDTLALLRDMGCDRVQGFLVSDPLEGQHFVPWLLHSAGAWKAHFAPPALPKETCRKPRLVEAE